jgi:putative RecB family exonuclease
MKGDIMTRTQAIQLLKDSPQLHLSFSQLWNYLACSLKYKFHYVENRPFERISANLFFGSAIHSAIERYYRTWKQQGKPETLKNITELFCDSINLELDKSDLPVLFKREAPDKDGLIQMGVAMLEAFHGSIDLDGYEIVDVELPLAATLYTDAGEPTDFKLVGVIDLLLMDKYQDLLVIDLKTAARAKSQSAVDEDLQFTSYAYLLGANRYTFPTAPVKCRMDVLRKLKTGPQLEYYHTTRTAEDRKRFAKLAVGVLNAIENKVFLPNRSWLCSDCQFVSACASW